MIDFVASGRVFDLVAAILALEGLALLLVGRLPSMRARLFPPWRRLAPGDLAGFVVAGLGLSIAARAAIREDDWTIVAAGLTIAFLAHVYDLRRRWIRAA
ncbi:hypothetical protein [Salinarimonas ramus]|uniref:Uncharacterized protein n=1 Tax=Salinarimonas ramus TaxID=690164 RepID=A0A917VAR0_9HYPH|nr:hypothetical protein [Salinarimonas ramus]GGK55099.1 hypothetical protein GCM10011322_47260 [Salinarimonas ramus]